MDLYMEALDEVKKDLKEVLKDTTEFILYNIDFNLRMLKSLVY